LISEIECIVFSMKHAHSGDRSLAELVGKI